MEVVQEIKNSYWAICTYISDWLWVDNLVKFKTEEEALAEAQKLTASNGKNYTACLVHETKTMSVREGTTEFIRG